MKFNFSKMIDSIFVSFQVFSIVYHSFGLGKKALLNCNLWFAIYDERIDDVKKALDKGANPNSYEKKTKICQLTHAMFLKGDKGLEIVNLLLDFGANPNGVFKEDTPLERAKELENKPLIELIEAAINKKSLLSLQKSKKIKGVKI